MFDHLCRPFLRRKSGLNFSKLQDKYEQCEKATDCPLGSLYRTCKEISEPILAILAVASDPKGPANSWELSKGILLKYSNLTVVKYQTLIQIDSCHCGAKNQQI